MTVIDDLRVLRKRWRIIALFLVAGLALAVLYVTTATTKYQSTTQLFVAAQDTGNSSSGLQSSDQFSQDRVKSYSDIIKSPTILQPVAAAYGRGLTAKQISREVSADAPPNTVLLNVHVTDTSRFRAQILANQISTTFASYAAQLETTPSTKQPPVKITVVTRAPLPTSPISPRTNLDIALGLIIGLAAGVVAAIVRETLDTTIKDSGEVQEELGLSALGGVARHRDVRSRPLIVIGAGRTVGGIDQFRKICTNLQYVDVDHPPRSIVITSSLPEEGKSVTAANLAISLAESGKHVILVEADLRRPRASEYLGIENAVGLTSVLVGAATTADAVQDWGDTGTLKVLSSGPIPPNPSELLGSKGMKALLGELEDDYGIVVLDAPPVLPVADAAVLTTIASGAVVVTKYGSTRMEQLARTVEELRGVGAKIYGSVLTMTPAKDSSTGGYGYGYEPLRNDQPRRPVNSTKRPAKRPVKRPAKRPAKPPAAAHNESS